ncbi:MAG: C4-type zinc ribbon domain-containing protein, partial [Dehalococcoidia bacterium]|nr:C4-type zinc ribbon domain-containing protein [Dehalococcoidia bacterium]
QELDLELAAMRTTLADVQARQGEPEELAPARASAAERQDAYRAAEKQVKEFEYQTEEQGRKIEPIERRLYNGNVKNPKELEDLQQDLESLKRRRSQLDEQALDAMEDAERAQRDLADAEGALQELTQATAVEQEGLRSQAAMLERKITELEARRAEQAARIDAGLLRLYDQLAATRQGRPIAKLEGGACQGCRISLPANILKRARAGGDLVQCTNCERILYVA